MGTCRREGCGVPPAGVRGRVPLGRTAAAPPGERRRSERRGPGFPIAPCSQKEREQPPGETWEGSGAEQVVPGPRAVGARERPGAPPDWAGVRAERSGFQGPGDRPEGTGGGWGRSERPCGLRCRGRRGIDPVRCVIPPRAWLRPRRGPEVGAGRKERGRQRWGRPREARGAKDRQQCVGACFLDSRGEGGRREEEAGKGLLIPDFSTSSMRTGQTYYLGPSTT